MAADSSVGLVAIMTPQPGKLDRCIQLMEQATSIVRTTEPGAIRYQFHVEVKGAERGDSVVTIEQYEDQAAWDSHCQGEATQFMSKAMTDEGILAKPPAVTFIKHIAGAIHSVRQPFVVEVLTFPTSDATDLSVDNHSFDTCLDEKTPRTMGLSKEDLLAHSRYIRNTLVPKVTKDPHLLSGNHALNLNTVRSTLHELEDTKMTTEVVRFSRIEKALQRIVEASGLGWPPDIVIKAQMLLARWEELLGPLQRVHTDLWAAGGRLEGLLKPKAWLTYRVPQLPETPAWSAKAHGDPARAHKEGHCGFQVGDWWLNCAAACFHGIVDNVQYHITADEEVAYAIALTLDTERDSFQVESFSYAPHSSDSGIFKLMATINGEQRKVVRVLRSWKLRSPLAPSAGLRYDGLYRVAGYSVKLENDSWRYVFHMKREDDQESLEKVLTIPNADQLDDWEDYEAGPTYSPDEEIVEGLCEGMEEEMQRTGVAKEGITGGHFTRNLGDPARLEGFNNNGLGVPR
ncbi:MAG: hypothetical protein Q9203_006394 [Teloschistes exilis]